MASEPRCPLRFLRLQLRHASTEATCWPAGSVVRSSIATLSSCASSAAVEHSFRLAGSEQRQRLRWGVSDIRLRLLATPARGLASSFSVASCGCPAGDLLVTSAVY